MTKLLQYPYTKTVETCWHFSLVFIQREPGYQRESTRVWLKTSRRIERGEFGEHKHYSAAKSSQAQVTSFASDWVIQATPRELQDFGSIFDIVCWRLAMWPLYGLVVLVAAYFAASRWGHVLYLQWGRRILPHRWKQSRSRPSTPPLTHDDNVESRLDETEKLHKTVKQLLICWLANKICINVFNWRNEVIKACW